MPSRCSRDCVKAFASPQDVPELFGQIAGCPQPKVTESPYVPLLMLREADRAYTMHSE